MIFNMSGGGAALNFNVVGSTSVPSNPKENTIWVNTDTEVSGYIFANKDPNLLDVENWATNIDVVGGTKTLSGGSITLTANNNTCYTSSGSELAHIRCTQGKTYVIQWDYSGTGDTNSVQLYPNMDTLNGIWAYANAGKLEYTATDNVTFFSFTFVVSANNTATYSNIRITEKELAFDVGAVWIYTGTASPVEFNALKKNCVMVYPVSVKQYVGGVWTGKTAMTYQNGSWVEWTTYMYNMGDTCDHLTGGWKTRAWGSKSNNNTAKEPTVTYNETSVTFENSSNTSKLACGVWEPVKDVDLTNAKEVKITILNATSTGKYKKLFFMANSNRNAYYHDDSIAAQVDIQGSNSAVTYTLNVEHLSGSYDLCVCGGSYNGTTLAEISKIWFVMKE